MVIFKMDTQRTFSLNPMSSNFDISTIEVGLSSSLLQKSREHHRAGLACKRLKDAKQGREEKKLETSQRSRTEGKNLGHVDPLINNSFSFHNVVM